MSVSDYKNVLCEWVMGWKNTTCECFRLWKNTTCEYDGKSKINQERFENNSRMI